LYHQLAETVAQYSQQSTPCIVDLGTGPGLLSAALITVLPNAEIIGIDPSEKMLVLAERNVSSSQFTAKLGSSEHLPLRNSSVDIVVSRFSLSYWRDLQQSFTEIYRVLKHKGIVILECINKECPQWRLSLIKLGMIAKRAGSRVITYHLEVYDYAYSSQEVIESLSTCGFSVLSEEGKQKGWRFCVIAQKHH